MNPNASLAAIIIGWFVFVIIVLSLDTESDFDQDSCYDRGGVVVTAGNGDMRCDLK